MAAINKNFVVRKGLEVNSDLIVANSDTNRVGIGTTLPRYKHHTLGGIGATFATITGVTTTTSLNIVSSLLINGAGATVGQYLGFNTTGLTWVDSTTLGGVRTSSAFTATTGQTEFNIAYEVGLVDVFVNGVKLSSDDFIETDGISILLNVACTGGEKVELIAYANVPTGIGVSGIPGINVRNNGTLVSSPLSVVNLDFVGATITTTGVGATINYQVEPTNNTTASNGVLSLNGLTGSVFTHTTSANIGIVSFSGINTSRANSQTFTVLVTQGNTPFSTTAPTGIGTQFATVVTTNGVGYTTDVKVSFGSTLTLTPTAGSLDLLTFIVFYDGSPSIAATNFKVLGGIGLNFRK